MTDPSNSPSPDRAPADIDAAAQDWLLRQAAGPLTPAELARFQAWRDADPRHRAVYDEVAALWADVGPLEHAFAPRGQGSVPAGKRLPARTSRGRSTFRELWRRLAPMAAGLAAACALVFVLGPTVSHLPARLLADHSTIAGEQRSVVLPDGSVALLNTDSAIDVAYSDRRRVVTLLQGEAWFEVRKDSERPFDVVAVQGRTTAVGTAFAVRDDAGSASVTVTEGVVSVTSPDVAAAASSDATVLLKAGEQVTYPRGAAPGPVRSVDPALPTAWRHGVIAIRDRPLAEALAEIGRYREGRIVLLDDASRYGPVTARLALRDIDGGIDALAATYGLSVTRVTDWLLIVR